MLTTMANAAPIDLTTTVTLILALDAWVKDGDESRRMWRVVGRQQYDLAARILHHKEYRTNAWSWRVWPPLAKDHVATGRVATYALALAAADDVLAACCRDQVS